MVKCQIKSIDYNTISMQNSVCKRIARSFELQRYIPEYQVYELCINWESEIPIPPTIFYLSEVFIYPYTLHEQPGAIKHELAPHNKIFVDPDTAAEQDNSTVVNKLSKSQFGSFGCPAIQAESKLSNRTLDYDQMMMSKAVMSELKARNRQIVRHVEYKRMQDSKKRRKT